MKKNFHLMTAFLPWILFSILHSHSLFWASLCAIILMVLLNFKELKRGFVLPLGSILVFAILAFNEMFFLSSWIESHSSLLINAGLAAIVWFSMIIGKPFTLQYAREVVDYSRWHHPIFLKINWILTTIWAILMTISALPSFFLTSDQIASSWFWNYGLSILCIVIGFKCNKTIPKMLGK